MLTDSILDSALEALLWQHTSSEGDNLIFNLSVVKSVNPELTEVLSFALERFLEEVGEVPTIDDEDLGHDFAMQLLGHGVGFWEEEGEDHVKANKAMDELFYYAELYGDTEGDLTLSITYQ